MQFKTCRRTSAFQTSAPSPGARGAWRGSQADFGRTGTQVPSGEARRGVRVRESWEPTREERHGSERTVHARARGGKPAPRLAAQRGRVAAGHGGGHAPRLTSHWPAPPHWEGSTASPGGQCRRRPKSWSDPALRQAGTARSTRASKPLSPRATRKSSEGSSSTAPAQTRPRPGGPRPAAPPRPQRPGDLPEEHGEEGCGRRGKVPGGWLSPYYSPFVSPAELRGSNLMK